MRVSMIAAIGKNRELGAKNALLWHIPEDMKYFQKKTLFHPIIMGRKTFESFARPLKNRTSIIVTRDKDYKAPEGIFVFDDIRKAVEFAKKDEKRFRRELKDGLDEEVYIIGGAQIFELGMSLADRLYLTQIHKAFPDAEVYFPEYKAFKKVIDKRNSKDENYKYTFETIER